MTGSASLSVLAAVRAALVGAAAFAAIAGDRVAAGLSQGTAYPAVGLEVFEVPDNTFGLHGRRVTVLLNAFSQSGGDEEVLALLDASIAALDFQALTVDGWDVVSIEFESSMGVREDLVQGVTTRQLPAYFVVTVNRA